MANLRTNNLSGVGVVSVNDGTTWSSFFEGSTHASGNYPTTAAFDGNISTFMYPAADTTITWTAPNGGIKGELIEVYVYAGNTHPIVRVNGVSTGAVVGSDLGQQGNWVDVTSLVGGNLKTITCYGEEIGGVDRQSGFSAVRVDGQILVDKLDGIRPSGAHAYGSSGGKQAYRGSVFFDGQNTRLEITASSDLALGTGDYTIEAWVLFRSIATYQAIIDFRTNNGNYPFIVRDTDGDLYYFINGSRLIDNIPARENNVWHHIAVVRSSGTTKFYLNGVSEGSASDSTNYIADQNVDIGASTNDNDFFGYISNLRITKEALYTGDFVPPSSELKVLSNTVLLCCQDSDNPTQEATGKTLTGHNGLSDVDLVKQQPKVIPPYGVDAGNNFNGAISMNSLSWMNFPTGRTEERGRGRALIAGGSIPSSTNNINFLDIQSSGTSMDFGDLTHARYDMGGCSNGVRGVFAGGRDPAGNEIDDTIDFVIIATTANAIDFGNLTAERGGTQGAVSNGWRGVWGGGFEPSQVNKIEFVTLATLSNSTDFGDLTAARSGCGRAMSTTRGLFASGGTPSAVNTIDYITINTTGNATDFGDTTESGPNGLQGTSSNTRGIFAGMGPGLKTINFVTIASTGNATDFGDMRFEASQRTGTGNSIRGIFAGGYISPTGRTTLIDQIEIATTGNATAFGDLITTTNYAGSTSDSHGGLS